MRRREFIAGMAALLPARALGANVLTACGSANFTPGTPGKWTVDTNGIVCSSGGAAAPVTSKWSGADAVAGGMTLSPDGLTVTPGAVPGWTSIRSTIGKSSGKLYVEFYASGGSIVGANPTIMFGVASAGFNAIDYLGDNPYSCGLFPSYGNTFVSSGFTSNYGPSSPVPTVGDVWAVAVDFGAGSLWLSRNNVWLNSSNPATASLPIASFVPATVGALFAGMSFQPGNVGLWTLQPTAASQKYAPPSGFTPWG